MRKCASGRNGGVFYRRGRKAAFDAGAGYPQLTLFIREVPAQDPRPAYRKGGRETGKTYAVWLQDLTFAGGVTTTQVLKFLLWKPR